MTADYEIVCDSTNRPEWLLARRTGIGASESPWVLGIDWPRWSSAMEVYADKISEDPPVDEFDERMEWGRILEPVILGWFDGEVGRPVEPAGELLRSKRWPFMLCTLDGWQEADVAGGGCVPRLPLEVKNTQDRAGWSDGVPQHVGIQLQHQMAVTGAPMASVAVLICGSEFKWRDVERDDKFIEETLVPECGSFWDRVLHKGPPPLPDASPATAKALARIYPNAYRESISLPGEFVDLHAQYKQLKAASKDNETRITEIKNLFRAAIGDADEGVLPAGEKWTWLADVNGKRTLRPPREE
jgi:putative phage-type endonuclease